MTPNSTNTQVSTDTATPEVTGPAEDATGYFAELIRMGLDGGAGALEKLMDYVNGGGVGAAGAAALDYVRGNDATAIEAPPGDLEKAMLDFKKEAGNATNATAMDAPGNQSLVEAPPADTSDPNDAAALVTADRGVLHDISGLALLAVMKDFPSMHNFGRGPGFFRGMEYSAKHAMNRRYEDAVDFAAKYHEEFPYEGDWTEVADSVYDPHPNYKRTNIEFQQRLDDMLTKRGIVRQHTGRHIDFSDGFSKTTHTTGGHKLATSTPVVWGL